MNVSAPLVLEAKESSMNAGCNARKRKSIEELTHNAVAHGFVVPSNFINIAKAYMQEAHASTNARCHSWISKIFRPCCKVMADTVSGSTLFPCIRSSLDTVSWSPLCPRMATRSASDPLIRATPVIHNCVRSSQNKTHVGDLKTNAWEQKYPKPQDVSRKKIPKKLCRTSVTCRLTPQSLLAGLESISVPTVAQTLNLRIYCKK